MRMRSRWRRGSWSCIAFTGRRGTGRVKCASSRTWGELEGGCDSGRCRPRVDELLCNWIDAEVQTLERASAEEDHISGFAEYDVIGGQRAGCVNPRRANPTVENRSVGL